MTTFRVDSWYPEDPATCLEWANAIVVLHFAVALYIALGQAAILLGWWRRWSFVRGRLFRLSHLAAIGIVAGIAASGNICPLTIWENELRSRAGEPHEQASFLAYWAHELLFIDIPVHQLGWMYLGFALLVLLSLRLVPVEWKEAH